MGFRKDDEKLITVNTPEGPLILVGKKKIICPSTCDGDHVWELCDRTNGHSEFVCTLSYAPKRFKEKLDESDLRNYLEDNRICIYWDAKLKLHSSEEPT